MRAHLPRRIGLLLGVALFLASGARAQDRPAEADTELVPQGPDPPALAVDSEAQRHVVLARRYFEEGQYDRSIQELEAAYQLHPDPNYLFSIAQAHRRAGRDRAARQAYQRFLKEAPPPLLRAEVENYVLEITKLIKEQERAEQERRRPVWKKGWFWGLLGGAAAAVGVSLGVGIPLGLRGRETPFRIELEQ